MFYYLLSTYAPGEISEYFLEHAISRVNSLRIAADEEEARLAAILDETSTPAELPDFATPTPDPFAPTAVKPDQQLSSGDYYTFYKGGIRLIGITSPSLKRQAKKSLPDTTLKPSNMNIYVIPAD